MKIYPIIGLEVHVELKTKTKMFCGCSTEHFHVAPNSHTCPICLGLPGALPVPNKQACDNCIKLGLALNCSINQHSFFERKNYFYPDLPKGYQITQYQKPFAVKGFLEVNGQKVGINRVHQEEDTGKSQHLNIAGESATLLDYNRSGVPLVEIVSEPDIHSPLDAKDYLLKMQQLIRYLGISDADIEKGSMRCEPTVNVCIDDKYYTPLVEIKNVASLTGVMTAIQYEIDRQVKQFESDHIEKNSSNKTTRGWNADKSETFLQREKEGSADYRYFPEPDIPPIVYSDEEIARLRSEIPELPEEKIKKYIGKYGLVDYAAKVITEYKDFANLFEFIVGSRIEKPYCTFVANILLGPFKTALDLGGVLDGDKIAKINFSELFDAVDHNIVSIGVARDTVVKLYEGNEVFESALDYIKKNGLIQVSDAGKIEEFAKQVIAANPKAVEDYRKNPASIGFLIGQLMRLSQGSANPQLAKEVLEKLLS